MVHQQELSPTSNTFTTGGHQPEEHNTAKQTEIETMRYTTTLQSITQANISYKMGQQKSKTSPH